MALNKITFQNKIALESSPAIDAMNKISDEDINEIKTVVNNGLSQVDTNTANIETLTNTLNTFISEIYKKVYPIGAHYITSSTENPNVLFPGTTWVQIKDTYIIAAGSTYKVGTTYGASSHTHTGAVHTHTVNGHTHTSAAHTHTINGHTHTSAAHTHTTGNHTLTIAEMPKHSHIEHLQSIGWSSSGNNNDWSQPPYHALDSDAMSTSETGGGGAHNHGNTGSTTPGATGSTSLTTNSTTPGATGSTSLTTNSASSANTGSASSLPPSRVRYVWERTA